nr:uncharacterized protein LOC110070704 [Pogona vitticeps]
MEDQLTAPCLTILPSGCLVARQFRSFASLSLQDLVQRASQTPARSGEGTCSFEEGPQDLVEGASQTPDRSGEGTFSFEEGLQALRCSPDPLAQEFIRAIETIGQFALRLFSEHQQLKSRLHRLEAQQQEMVSRHLDEKAQLQEAVRELKRNQEASRAQQTARQRSASRPSPSTGVRTLEKDFHVQVQTTGKTYGYDGQFLQDVSTLLSRQGVSLKVKGLTENSKHLLLVFCPIASRMGTDIENALERLSSERMVLLVVMHYVQKDNPGTSVDAKHRVPHPAVVGTVHTRFTLQDGFYPCEMNERAVADVAAALKALAEDHGGGGGLGFFWCPSRVMSSCGEGSQGGDFKTRLEVASVHAGFLHWGWGGCTPPRPCSSNMLSGEEFACGGQRNHPYSSGQAQTDPEPQADWAELARCASVCEIIGDGRERPAE